MSVAIILLVLAFSIQVLAVVPVDSGGATVLLPVTINSDTGDQFFAHIDGDIAPYAAPAVNGFDYQVNYYNFFTGETHAVPQPTGFQEVNDYWSDISGSKIAFWRETVEYPNVTDAIVVYDVTTGVTTEAHRLSGLFSFAAIGGNSVAFMDRGGTWGEVYVSNLSNLNVAPIQLTNNAGTADDRIEQYPRVAPSGNVIVWQSCPVSGSYNCDIEKAVLNGSTWTVSRITNTPEFEQWVNTDGALIVYERLTVPNYEHSQICWQPVAGGAEQCLEMDGSQRTPSVSNGVISFSSTPTGGSQADLYVYEVARIGYFASQARTIRRPKTFPRLRACLMGVSASSGMTAIAPRGQSAVAMCTARHSSCRPSTRPSRSAASCSRSIPIRPSM